MRVSCGYCAWLPLFFLMGTNSLTNPFAHNLHDDALAQLVTAGAYWLLLEYVSTRKRLVLVLMAILPAIGFLVKQSLAIWALFYCVYLVFFDQPRSIPRIAIFTILVFGGIGLVVGVLLYSLGKSFLLLDIYCPWKTWSLSSQKFSAYA